MSNEATCALCGTTYRGAALDRLDVHEWERRDGVLHELRWCLCQHPRMGRDTAKGSAVMARPDMGANVVLLRERVLSRSRMWPTVILRGTATQWTAEKGESFVRHGKDAGQRRGDHDRYGRIPPDELARAEAWAKAQETKR